MPLTEEQARQFLAAVKGHRLEPLYRVALGLGMREGEILALRWDNVDLTAKTLQIVEGKTKSSTRTLALPPALAVVLQGHYECQQEERLVRGSE